jgi:hypothetical protein
MTTKTLNTLMAGLVAASLGTAALVTPASAGGQVSITVLPGSAKHEQAMRAGLGIYALARGIQNGSIKQHGRNNTAGLSQLGKGNLGIVHQEGNGHNGTLTQNGSGNAFGLFQFGNNTNGHVNQHGGQTGATFQFGW